jgi:hypothetical protein
MLPPRYRARTSRAPLRSPDFFHARTVAFSRHERATLRLSKVFLSARLQRVVLAVFVRVLTRTSDQAQTKMIPDAHRQRNIVAQIHAGRLAARRNELTGENGENRGELSSLSVYSAPSVFNPTAHLDEHRSRTLERIDRTGIAQSRKAAKKHDSLGVSASLRESIGRASPALIRPPTSSMPERIAIYGGTGGACIDRALNFVGPCGGPMLGVANLSPDPR